MAKLPNVMQLTPTINPVVMVTCNRSLCRYNIHENDCCSLKYITLNPNGECDNSRPYTTAKAHNESEAA